MYLSHRSSTDRQVYYYSSVFFSSDREDAVHLKFGFRAAATSSNLPIDFVYGAPLTIFGFSFISLAMLLNADANLSIVSLLSVSVGSIINASRTIRGK